MLKLVTGRDAGNATKMIMYTRYTMAHSLMGTLHGPN